MHDNMKRQRASLSDLCSLIKGASPISKTPPGPYPLITTGEEHKTANTFQLDTEAVCIPLISSTGHGHASIKRVHYQTGKYALANLLAAAVVKDRSVLSTSYLARYLMFTKDRLIAPLMTGAANMSISLDRLATVPVEFPPLPEQERIAKLMDQAEELRKLRAQADRRTAALLPALFHEIFGDPSTNPKGFHKEALEKLVRVKSGDPLLAKDMDAEGEFPVYGGNGITGYHSKFMFDQPVIVIGRVGAYCGAIHVSKPKSWVTDNALYVSELKEPFNQEYLAAALRVANLNQYAGRAAQPLVSGGRIYPVPILVPPLTLQDAFAKGVTEIRELEAQQAASRRGLNNLFQSMLNHAFNGEL